MLDVLAHAWMLPAVAGVACAGVGLMGRRFPHARSDDTMWARSHYLAQLRDAVNGVPRRTHWVPVRRASQQPQIPLR